MMSGGNTFFSPTLALVLLTSACSSNHDGGNVDSPDAQTFNGDASVSLFPDGNAQLAEPIVTPLSSGGSDQFFAVAFAPDSTFYAAGYSAPGFDNASDRSIALARFLADGQLDPSFGDGGVVHTNVSQGGGNGELARGLVVQSDGKIVVGGTAEHDPLAEGLLATDKDIVLLRFAKDGALDQTFGENGIRVIDLNHGVISGDSLAGADNLWNIVLGSEDSLIIHGNQRSSQGDGNRTDTDWAMLRLDADGQFDNSFSDDGIFTLDLQEVNGNARAAVLLPDGNILGTGYANTPGLGSTQPVIYKLTSAGVLDQEFGTNGIFHETVLPAVTEVYGAVLVNGNLVTAGYGKSVADAPNDVVSLRLTSEGELDTTWGENGAVVIDVNAFNDQSRSLLALPDNRVLLVGAGTPTDGSSDAMVVVLDENGHPDLTMFPDGRKLFDLGGPTDHFWGAALSPDGKQAVVVGLRGAGMNASATLNDDAAIFLMPTH